MIPVGPFIIQIHTLCSSLPDFLDLLLSTLLPLLFFLQTYVSGFEWALILTLFIQLERNQTYNLGNEMSLSLLENLIPPFTQHPPSAQGATSAAQTDLPRTGRSCAHHPSPNPLGTVSSQSPVENQVLMTLSHPKLPTSQCQL